MAFASVHRWSGRAYVFASIPGGLAILTVSAVTYWGPNQHAANTTLGVLWVLTTVAGYMKARKHRYAEHREWIVRSFALCFSIILNRAWTAACTAFLVSDPNDYAQLAQAIGVGSWLSWIVNLLVAEWWLQHTRVTRQVR